MKSNVYNLCLTIIGITTLLLGAATMLASETGTNQPHKEAVLFHFLPRRLMFLAPFKQNEQAIQDVRDMIDAHEDDIKSGKAVVAVRGYCEAFDTEAQNRFAAKNRSNQVKSYFITNHWMKEKWYNTKNQLTSYYGIDGVCVVVFIKYIGEEDNKPEPIADNIEDYKRKSASLTLAKVQTNPVLLKQTYTPLTLKTKGNILKKPFEQKTSVTSTYIQTRWYLKTNLIYDLALMPSLELEYRFNDRWSASVEGNLAWWKNTDKIQYYQMASIIPEARWWFRTDGKRKGHYLGAFLGGGWYDLENGGTGFKGEGIMTGISYGYMFPIGKALAFEAGVGLGYMNTWYEVYEPIDQCFVYQESRNMNYFGPLRLKFSLVWNIGINKKTGGVK